MVTKARPTEQYVIQTTIWNYRESSFNTVIFIPNKKVLRGGALGRHFTFRILSLKRYVVDIVKSSPNPNLFLKFNENGQTGSLPKFNSWTFSV